MTRPLTYITDTHTITGAEAAYTKFMKAYTPEGWKVADVLLTNTTRPEVWELIDLQVLVANASGVPKQGVYVYLYELILPFTGWHNDLLNTIQTAWNKAHVHYPTGLLVKYGVGYGIHTSGLAATDVVYSKIKYRAGVE